MIFSCGSLHVFLPRKGIGWTSKTRTFQTKMTRTVSPSLTFFRTSLFTTESAPLFTVELFSNSTWCSHYITFFISMWRCRLRSIEQFNNSTIDCYACSLYTLFANKENHLIIVITWAWLLENEELCCVARLNYWYFLDFACCFFYCCLTILHLSIELLCYYCVFLVLYSIIHDYDKNEKIYRIQYYREMKLCQHLLQP